MFYSEFADSYDEMINWKSRLKNEKAHFRKLFRRHGVRKVFDAACGTGMHCILFSQLGFKVVGADNNPEMLEQARKNIKKAGVKGIRLFDAEFTSLTRSVKGSYDAVVCLGNSLPHLTDDNDLKEGLRQFYKLLRPGGLFVLQLVYFDYFLDTSASAVAVTEGVRDGRPVVFRRHYEFKGTKVTFHISVYDSNTRDLLENYFTPLNPIRRELLEIFMEKTGFGNIQFYQDLALHALTSDSKSQVALAIRPKD